MDKDDTAELLWKSGQVVRSTQAQRPTSDPPILRGSGSGGNAGEEENDPLPLLPPPPYQSILIHEEEMASWFRHPLPQDYYGSGLLYSGGIASTPATQVEIPVSLAPTPSAPHDFSTGQIIAENFMNLSMLRGNIITGGRVEAGSLIPVVRDSTQVDASATPSSSATVIRGVSPTFAVPGHGQVFEIAGTSSSWICKVETEPIQVQPATETEITNDRKRKERLDDIEETKEARGSASRKRSRAAEMYNLSERRRREKMNERIKVLQELIPRCNKSDKVSVLDDVIEYVKSIQMHVRILQNKRCGMVEHGKSFHESNLWGFILRHREKYTNLISLSFKTLMTSMGQYHNMMYSPNMQQFMAMGMMGMNRPSFVPFPGTPFPRPAHIASLGPSSALPYSYPNTQAFDPSGVHMPSPLANQPQFPGYMNPYGQFVGPQQTQQPPPPPLQHQTSSLLSFVQASSSKEPEYQDNQPTSG